MIKNYHLITQRNQPVGFRVTELEEAELQALCSELSQYYYDMLTKPLNLTSWFVTMSVIKFQKYF